MDESADQYSYRTGPYEVVFLDVETVSEPKSFERWIDKKTHFMLWGVEDAKVGDWFKFDLPETPYVQITRAILVLGKLIKVNEIDHGHRFLITFDQSFSFGRPLGRIHYARCCGEPK